MTIIIGNDDPRIVRSNRHNTGKATARVSAADPDWFRDRVTRELVHERIRNGVIRHLSDNEVALYAGCSTAAVLRYRTRHKIAPNYTPGRTR